MTDSKQCVFSYHDAIAFIIESRSVKKQKVKNIIRELVYFGLFDRRLFDEYGILTSEELQQTIQGNIDERYRLIDAPAPRREKKKRKQAKVIADEPLMSVEALMDELDQASIERIAKSVGSTEQSIVRTTLDEFIAYQREVGNADNRTMSDMKKHFINYLKKKLKTNVTTNQNTRRSDNVTSVQSADDKDREFWKNFSKNAKRVEVIHPYDDVPF